MFCLPSMPSFIKTLFISPNINFLSLGDTVIKRKGLFLAFCSEWAMKMKFRILKESFLSPHQLPFTCCDPLRNHK